MIDPRVNFVIAGWVNSVIVPWVNSLTLLRLRWVNYLIVDNTEVCSLRRVHKDEHELSGTVGI